MIYDLAQLIHQQELAPVTIIGHSLGGNIALRYAGIYPDNVRRLVAIEGVAASPEKTAERARLPRAERMHKWIEETRRLAGRLPRRYPSIDDALKRMQEANQHLSPEQARHLTQYGVNQNEDGTYSWKFDNYTRANCPTACRKPRSSSCGRAFPVPPCWSTARKAGPQTPRPTVACGTSGMPVWSRSTAPGIGFTTTSSMPFSTSSGVSSELASPIDDSITSTGP